MERGGEKQHIYMYTHRYKLLFRIAWPSTSIFKKGPVWMLYNMLRLACTKSMNKYALIRGLTTYTHTHIFSNDCVQVNEWMCCCPIIWLQFVFLHSHSHSLSLYLFFFFCFCYWMCVTVYLRSIFCAMGLLFHFDVLSIAYSNWNYQICVVLVIQTHSIAHTNILNRDHLFVCMSVCDRFQRKPCINFLRRLRHTPIHTFFCYWNFRNGNTAFCPFTVFRSLVHIYNSLPLPHPIPSDSLCKSKAIQDKTA